LVGFGVELLSVLVGGSGGGGGGRNIRYDVYVSMISQHTRQSFELKFNSRN